MRRKTRDYSYDTDEVEDGGVVRVPLLLKDSLHNSPEIQRVNALMNSPGYVRDAVFDAENHRPHFARVSPADAERRRTAREDYLKRTLDAWKCPGRVEPDEPDEPTNGDDDLDDRGRAYNDYKIRLQNAWRSSGKRMVVGAGPGAIGPGPKLVGAGPTDSQTSHRRLLSSDAAKAMRDAAYQAYCDKLYNAWRGG